MPIVTDHDRRGLAPYPDLAFSAGGFYPQFSEQQGVSFLVQQGRRRHIPAALDQTDPGSWPRVWPRCQYVHTLPATCLRVCSSCGTPADKPLRPVEGLAKAQTSYVRHLQTSRRHIIRVPEKACWCNSGRLLPIYHMQPSRPYHPTDDNLRCPRMMIVVEKKESRDDSESVIMELNGVASLVLPPLARQAERPGR